MQAVNTTVDVARLYDELRDYIRANDQAAIQRVMAELVRAKRPLAEIVGEIKRLSRESASMEPGAELSAADEWSQSGIAPQSVEPPREPTSEPSYTHFTSTPSPSGAAVYREPEREAAARREWVPADRSPDVSPSRAEPNAPRFDGSAAFDLRGRPDIPTIPTIAHVVPSEEPRAEDPVATNPGPTAAPYQGMAEPPVQSFERRIEAETAAPVATPAAARVDANPAAYEPEAQSSPAHLDQAETEAGLQISGRAMALGVGVDTAEEPDITQTKLGSRPSGARLAAALAIIVVLVGGGAFLLLKPAAEKTADQATASTTAGLAPAPKPPVAEAVRPAAAPGSAAGERVPGLAATALLPSPSTAPAATAAPTASASASAVPPPSPAPAPQPPPAPRTDSPVARTPDAKPAVASLEPSNAAAPKTGAPPDKAAPVTVPAIAPTPAPVAETSPPAQPRPSATEMASLLESGDRLFGMGDVISARLFYERAAEAGDGPAALRLGETYDPTFLERAKLRAIKGDLKAAAFWYRRAKELGVVEADILLKGLQTK